MDITLTERRKWNLTIPFTNYKDFFFNFPIANMRRSRA